jgi:hypothetical protein
MFQNPSHLIKHTGDPRSLYHGNRIHNPSSINPIAHPSNLSQFITRNLCNNHITSLPTQIMNLAHPVFDPLDWTIYTSIDHPILRIISQNIIPLYTPFIPHFSPICMPPKVNIYLGITHRYPKGLLKSTSIDIMRYLQREVSRKPREHLRALKIDLIRSCAQLNVLVKNCLKIPCNAINLGSRRGRSKPCHSIPFVVRIALRSHIRIGVLEFPQFLDLIGWLQRIDMIVSL